MNRFVLSLELCRDKGIPFTVFSQCCCTRDDQVGLLPPGSIYFGIHTRFEEFIFVVYKKTQCCCGFFGVQSWVEQLFFGLECFRDPLYLYVEMLQSIELDKFILEEFGLKPYLVQVDDLEEHLLFLETGTFIKLFGKDPARHGGIDGRIDIDLSRGPDLFDLLFTDIEQPEFFFGTSKHPR